MSIFVVFRVADTDAMAAAVAEKYPNDNFKVQNDEWLISASGSAQELSDRLGVTNNNKTGNKPAGNAIVFRMDGYYGRASSDIWDWIKGKLEATNG